VDQAGEELEWKTRRNRIDPELRALGWDIVPFKTVPRNSEHDAAKISRNRMRLEDEFDGAFPAAVALPSGSASGSR
jgi:hypothetical protein